MYRVIVFIADVLEVLVLISVLISQDLETGCPKLAIVEFLGVQNFYREPQYTKISTKNMHRFMNIRHDILKYSHGNYMEMKIFFICLRLTF